MSLSALPEGHSELTRMLRRWGDPAAAEAYLDLLAELLSALGLPNGHPQLVTNPGRPQSQYVMAATLGMRYLLAFNRPSGQAFFILPRSYAAGHPSFEVTGHFNSLRTEKSVPPAFGMTSNFAEALADRRVREDWKAAAAAEIDRQSKSTFRRYHRPALYEAAASREYRSAAFYDAFSEAPPEL